MMQQPPAVSAQARLTISQAFDRFAVTVTQDDRRDFTSTELRDVREAALQVEKDLRARRSLRNLRRLQPFLQGLEHYSKSIEILCNGTDYLPWIWAPVKLMLQVSADFLSAFEKLIDAYTRIADTLPRFDRLSSALKHDHNFQAVLAFFYADILEFHRRAYKLVRRRAWKLLFITLWGQFESCFDSILASLSYHSDLVDRQAMSVNISEATERRKLDQERWDEQERTWRATKHRAVISWLEVDGMPLDDQLDELLKDVLPSSCYWFIHHPKTELWLNDCDANSLMWLHGKPGAGKSVICSSLVQFMESQKPNILYYFCSYLENVTDHATRLLRSLTAQAIQMDLDVAVYIHDDYLPSHPVASRRALRNLLPRLLEGIESSRIVIDGIDEWDPKEQMFVLDDILPMLSINSLPCMCKILVSSRDVPTVSRGLMRKGRITPLSLGDEDASIKGAIESYIDKRLSEFRHKLNELDPDGAGLSQLRLNLMERSDGMFLWVRLVLDSLETVYSPEEIPDVVANLPSDLFDLYTRILERMCNPRDSTVCEKVSRILQWICFSQRPLNKFELLNGLALTPDKTALSGNNIPIPRVLELCKPLVEERPDSSIAFVHFSVREFLLKPNSRKIVRPTEAHHNITFACAATVMGGLDLLDPDIAATERLIRVGSGGYRLLPYALEYWTEHFLQYAATGGDLDQNHHLSRYLSAMWSKHNHLSHILENNGGDAKRLGAPASAEQLDRRLELVAHLQIYGLLRGIYQDRWAAVQAPCDNGKAAEEYAVRNDGTLFSRLSADFEGLVLYLLSQDRILGLSGDKLEVFKRSYALAAYRCRYVTCPSSSVGFASAQLREQHEAEHLHRIYCKISTCRWSQIGFKNKTGLDKHMKNHHSQGSHVLIPPRVRRSAAQDRQAVSPPPDDASVLRGPEMWTCCQCGGQNSADTLPSCTMCGHISCVYCVVTLYE